MKPTEIHGPNGELIFLPQSPAEIVHATHCYEDLVIALRQLTVRFSLEFKTTENKCTCLQFEDNNNCRHLFALQVLTKAEAPL